MKTLHLFVAVVILLATLSISNSNPIQSDRTVGTEEYDERQGKQLSTGSSDITAVVGTAAATGSQPISRQPLPGNGFGNSVRRPGPIAKQSPQTTGTNNKAAAPAQQAAKQSQKGSSGNQGNKNSGNKNSGKDKDSSEEDSNEDSGSQEASGQQPSVSYETENESIESNEEEE